MPCDLRAVSSGRDRNWNFCGRGAVGDSEGFRGALGLRFRSVVPDRNDVSSDHAAESAPIFFRANSHYTLAEWHASGSASRHVFVGTQSRGSDSHSFFPDSSAVKSRNFFVYFASCPATRHSLFLLICLFLVFLILDGIRTDNSISHLSDESVLYTPVKPHII